ncbi:anaerobic ribonucleoside-triphosphate reductase activating protein [Aminipila butyrica]|uniref:Anaerobic ribonucleoside-triphosphate reductase-activating protein n=1 Tax=Aminipila butyrica TaxID=433296 RepID=A0A858BTV5_9FIRM|nr:anaerobic ribonucleoside-triphosphate reductase activating protein [Aminipila butyrica]QIB69363.1 anaerobic ribonucleoside-triphosphate reductase activating protein [Aminipila butyrica]
MCQQDKWNPSKTETLRIAGVIRESIVDGPGIRFTVFCQGCPHDCPGCHNPHTHDFAGGYDCSIAKILAEVDKDPLLTGVTLSGGEPLCQPRACAELARQVQERGLDVVLFSGYTLEELEAMAEKEPAVGDLLARTDYLIDGRFILAEKDLTLQFRGSQNQRVIDMKATRKQGQLVLAT